MTNEQFLKELDNIVQKKQSVETTQQFLRLLLKGYNQDLGILISGVNKPNSDVLNQMCLLDSNNQKVMLYYTDYRYADHSAYNYPKVLRSVPHCVEARLRSVINNALNNKTVSAIVFNHGTPNEYFILQIILKVVFIDYLD